jgi:hypothetical protein
VMIGTSFGGAAITDKSKAVHGGQCPRGTYLSRWSLAGGRRGRQKARTASRGEQLSGEVEQTAFRWPIKMPLQTNLCLEATTC